MKEINTKIYKSTFAYKVINNDLLNGMLNHAYLICGEDDVLNKLVCVEIAKHVFCGENNAPCGKCLSCTKIEHNNQVDLKFFPLSNKGFSVEDANAIVEEANILPYENNIKIYVINNFENATVQAQNKLLKTIEEPPKSAMFLINTVNANKVLNTILSRTKKINVGSVNTELIKEFLVDKTENVNQIAELSLGGLTRANALISDDKIIEINNICKNVFVNLNASHQVLKFSYEINSYAGKLQEFLENLTMYAYDLSMIINNNEKGVINKHALSELKNVAINYNNQMLNVIIKQINNARKMLQANCGAQAVTDSLLLNILEAKFKCKK